MIQTLSGNRDVPGLVVGVGTEVPAGYLGRAIPGERTASTGRISSTSAGSTQNKGCPQLFEYFLRFKARHGLAVEARPDRQLGPPHPGPSRYPPPRLPARAGQVRRPGRGGGPGHALVLREPVHGHPRSLGPRAGPSWPTPAARSSGPVPAVERRPLLRELRRIPGSPEASSRLGPAPGRALGRERPGLLSRPITPGTSSKASTSKSSTGSAERGLMDVHQFATSLTYGDAISDEMLEIRSVLREHGLPLRDLRPVVRSRARPGTSGITANTRAAALPDNVVIFHFSIGSPVSKMFFRVPDRKMMIYHNITPHEFFLDAHRILARECYKGRLEINLFVGQGRPGRGRFRLQPPGAGRGRLRDDRGPADPDELRQVRRPRPIPSSRASSTTGRRPSCSSAGSSPTRSSRTCIKVFYFYKKHLQPRSPAHPGRGLPRPGALSAALQDLDRPSCG